MKTKLFLAAVVLAANCAIADAQVLGGNAVGGVGGSLGGAVGGMRDIGVTGRGSAHGSLGTDLDTGDLRRTSRDVAGRATNRTRTTVGSARELGSDMTSATTAQGAAVANDARANAIGAAGAAASRVDAASITQQTRATTQGSAGLDAAASKSVSTSSERGTRDLPLAANGAVLAEGDASASKQGVSARGSADSSATVTAGK